jgi:hypothetical protein
VVIIKRVSGQLANRLHFFSHFAANSKAYNYSLLITCFPEFYDLFTPVSDNKLKVTITSRGFGQRIINKFLNELHAIAVKFKVKFPGVVFHSIAENDRQLLTYDINAAEFVKLVQHQVVIPEGWVYRDFANLKKYLPEIRNLFSPREEFKKEVSRDIDLARSMGNVLIGVHIRRGDYIDFNDGKWFYDNNVYKNKMHDVEQAFNGKQCVFILCSNEPLNKEEFAGFKTLIAERPAIVDLYLLAGCDYIFGPPSTYTGWASLYNTVPACYVETADQKITIESFKEFFD